MTTVFAEDNVRAEKYLTSNFSSLALLLAEHREAAVNEYKTHLADILKVRIECLERADYATIAEMCRKTPGKCFCGVHVTPIA